MPRFFMHWAAPACVAVLFWSAGYGLYAESVSPGDAARSSETTTPEQEAAIKAISDAGGAVRRIAQDTDAIEVTLGLAPPPIQDDLMPSIAAIDNVVWLELQGTAITDAGLETIGSVATLRRLHLERTGITDTGLEHLSGLSDLEYLNIYGTKVTDKGLEHLKPLTKLRKVYVWRTEVTDEGIARLREAMPDLEVIGAAKPLIEPKVDEKATAEKSSKEASDKASAEADARVIKAPEKLLAEGVAVRVTLPGANYLSLAEVEVYPVGKAEKLTGKAAQSSTYPKGDAAKAIDGNRNGVFAAGSVTHTENGAGQWWSLTFPEKKSIGSIHLWNRSDCCGERLNGAVVEILDKDDKVVWSDTIKEGADGGTYDFVGK